MKKKVVVERDLQIRLKKSKKMFKFQVNNDIRLKELANEMCRMLGLNPYSTTWSFHVPIPEEYEVPIS